MLSLTSTSLLFSVSNLLAMKYKGTVSSTLSKDCLSLFSSDIRVHFGLRGEKILLVFIASGKICVDFNISKAVYQVQKMKLGVEGGRSRRAEAFKSHHTSGRVTHPRQSSLGCCCCLLDYISQNGSPKQGKEIPFSCAFECVCPL